MTIIDHCHAGLALAKQCWMGTQGVTVGYEHSVQSTGVWGHAPPEEFCNLDILRYNMVHF